MIICLKYLIYFITNKTHAELYRQVTSNIHRPNTSLIMVAKSANNTANENKLE